MLCQLSNGMTLDEVRNENVFVFPLNIPPSDEFICGKKASKKPAVILRILRDLRETF
jgi:hypothetical protein